jgi:glycosyltransferase involved in cell wall biosynthesis
MSKNIGFVSTRFAGTDGVSLESSKWADVLEKIGYRCFWFAGELDRNPETAFLVPEAHFQHEQNKWIDAQVFGKKRRGSSVTNAIHDLRSYLKDHLYSFIKKFKIDLIIAENALTIPMHLPLGLALTELIAETYTPTIAHHHDFYWERVRFKVNAVSDYIGMAFPPNLPNIENVVINSEAREELAHRKGISSSIIPNVLDFENPPKVDVNRAKDFRRSIDLSPDDIIILQPTRIIKRKGIEYAIELVKELNDCRCKLVISHEAGDEGFEYPRWLQEYASEHNVDLRLVKTKISDPWNHNGEVQNKFSLWDIYPHADFITYPSTFEGFGNAFIEAVYFKKPILINRYSTFVRDIEPYGFDLAVMDGFLNKETVEKVKKIIGSPQLTEKMVSSNYEIASRHFSYSILRRSLNSILVNFFGEIIPKHQEKVVTYLAKSFIKNNRFA